MLGLFTRARAPTIGIFLLVVLAAFMVIGAQDTGTRGESLTYAELETQLGDTGQSIGNAAAIGIDHTIASSDNVADWTGAAAANLYAVTPIDNVMTTGVFVDLPTNYAGLLDVGLITLTATAVIYSLYYIGTRSRAPTTASGATFKATGRTTLYTRARSWLLRIGRTLRNRISGAMAFDLRPGRIDPYAMTMMGRSGVSYPGAHGSPTTDTNETGNKESDYYLDNERRYPLLN